MILAFAEILPTTDRTYFLWHYFPIFFEHSNPRRDSRIGRISIITLYLQRNSKQRSKFFAYVHKLATLHSNADAPRLRLSLLEISKNKKSHIITSDLVIWVCQKEFFKSFENNRLFVKVQLLTLCTCTLYLMLSLLNIKK